MFSELRSSIQILYGSSKRRSIEGVERVGMEGIQLRVGMEEFS